MIIEGDFRDYCAMHRIFPSEKYPGQYFVVGFSAYYPSYINAEECREREWNTFSRFRDWRTMAIWAIENDQPEPPPKNEAPNADTH